MATLKLRQYAHDYTVLYQPAHGHNEWGDFSAGGPCSLLTNAFGVCPRALSPNQYNTGERWHDVVHALPGTYEHTRSLHPHVINTVTGQPEEIFYPLGMGGKHNRHNPFHNQYQDPLGNLVLDVTDFAWYDPLIGRNNTVKKTSLAFDRAAYRIVSQVHGNLNIDGKKVQRDLAMGGFFNRWPTAATAPAGWPAAMVQPAGGRVSSARDGIWHACRGGGICAMPSCVTTLDFYAMSTSPHCPYWARDNDMIHHYGMESVNAADNNILGWVCRAHGVH